MAASAARATTSKILLFTVLSLIETVKFHVTPFNHFVCDLGDFPSPLIRVVDPEQFSYMLSPYFREFILGHLLVTASP